MAKKESTCNAKSEAKVSTSTRQKINADLIKVGMDGNSRFRSAGQALASIAEVLKSYDIEWDEVLDGFRFSQAKGRALIYLAAQTDDVFCPISIANTSLSFQWETLSSGVEVIAYLG